VVIPEVALVDHAHDVVLVSGVLLHYVVQVLRLLVGELMIHLGVACDLHGQHLLSLALVVDGLYHLSEGTFAEDSDHLVSVGQVVANRHLVVAFDVIESWVALVLSVAVVVALLSSLFLEAFLFVSDDVLHHGQIFTCSPRDGPSEVNHRELRVWAFQFFGLFRQQFLRVERHEALNRQRESLIPLERVLLWLQAHRRGILGLFEEEGRGLVGVLVDNHTTAFIFNCSFQVEVV